MSNAPLSIQSNARASGQITSDFLTQGGWRLYGSDNIQLACVQPPTSLHHGRDGHHGQAGHLGGDGHNGLDCQYV